MTHASAAMRVIGNVVAATIAASASSRSMIRFAAWP
jgi:hypothetical protein